MSETQHFVAVANGDIIWVTINPDGVHNRRIIQGESGKYVREWIGGAVGAQQICKNGSLRGPALTWHGATVEDRARNFAKDIRGRHYRSRAALDRAVERCS